ncbi:hypothetical protein POM88_036459 [Heracleum sosnowskyi]|uniref:Uncharacterized protein n=1 Tax=Heracleum sosnowskyi TaxID=360622 RepID=A0AAD8MEW4_9APIA|nr:hypothetical protein POM88_036459 [Heracleum sosnowskyi]
MEILKGKSGLKFWRGRKDKKLLKNKMVDADTRRDADVISVLIGGSEVESHSENEGEVVRMKILVKTEDLDKVLQFVRANTRKSSDNSSISSSFYLEDCINALKRRRLSRANPVKSIRCHPNSSWSPVLHSIPE